MVHCNDKERNEKERLVEVAEEEDDHIEKDCERIED